MLASRPIPIYRLAGLAIAALPLLCVPSSAEPAAPTQPAGQPATKAQAAANYGRIPLSFEANRGQTDPSVQFLSHGQGYMLFLRQGEAVLALKSGKPSGPNPASSAGSPGIANAPSSDFESSVVRLQLAGANPHASVREEDRQITRTNYFIGKDPAKWRTDIPNYSRVRYADVYPGIDLVYYGNQRQLEYDFVVAPGTDPKTIRLGFDGGHLKLDRDGNLNITAKNGEIVFHKPVVYQEIDGKRHPVAGSFALLGRSTLGFRLGSYDHAKPVVIDPVLAYSTYLGGAFYDQGMAIAVDAKGCAYVTGSTVLSEFPTTKGAFQTVDHFPGTDGGNAFVTKMNATGTALVYSTYLGGSGPPYVGYPDTNSQGDFGSGIALDNAGDAFVTGTAISIDFPTTANAFQGDNRAAVGGNQNAFVTKLNPTGTALIYSTYLGGSGDPGCWFCETGDDAFAIAVDASGDAYVTGYAISDDFPVTANAFQPVDGRSTSKEYLGNSFVTEFNPTGTAVIYSSYLGGSLLDVSSGIAVDGYGDAYVTGFSESPDFPVTQGAFQTVNNASFPWGRNAFVTKINPTGTALVYSTYLGGSARGSTLYSDQANGIAVDSSGDAYVTGTAASTDFPVTAGAFQTMNHFAAVINSDLGVLAPGANAFVTKFDPTGTGLIYSTYLGGSGSPTHGDSGNGIAVDSAGNAYLAGQAGSTDFPLTPGAAQTVNHGASRGVQNVFVAKLNPLGTALEYSTYLGGSGVTFCCGLWGGDGASGIALDSSGGAFVTGTAISNDFPTTSGVIEPVKPGTDDLFVAGFALGSATKDHFGAAVTVTSNKNPVHLGEDVTFTASVQPNGGSGAPTGSVVFSWSGCSSTCISKPITLSPADSASLMTSFSSRNSATIPILARYSGDSSVVNSVGFVMETVSGYAQTLTFHPPASVTFGVAPIELTANASASSGLPVTFNVISGKATMRGTVVAIYGTGPVVIQASQPGNLTYAPATPVNGTITVLPAALTVTAVDAYQLARATPGGFSYILSGFVRDETAKEVVSGAPTLQTTAFASSPAGSYAITPSLGTLRAANYTFKSFANGVLNIFAPINFGSQAVDTTGNHSFRFPYGPANPIGSASIVTTGDQKPEFSGASIDCGSGACTAKLSFLPHAPGLWAGAYQIFDASSPANLLVSIPVYGAGTGPQMVFDPGVQASVEPTGEAALGSPLGVALDANGALYIADESKNRVVKVSGKTVSVVALSGVTLKAPSALALDGAGNLYIADTGNGRVVELNRSGAAQVLPVGNIALAGSSGLEADGAGDIYIADAGIDRIVRVSAVGVASVLSTEALRLSSPTGLAVDALGDLFIADAGNNRIVKIASTGAASVVSTGTPALRGPTGITVDPAGTLYIAEAETGKLVEVSPGGVQTELLASGLSSPHGIALDHSGVLYIADTGNHRVLELERNAFPTLSFASTTVGKEDAGGPQTVTVRNIGNTDLTIADVTFPADFPEDASGKSKDCKAGKTLAAAASCTLTIDFKPVTPVKKGTSAALKEAVKVTSNSLNNSGAVQKVAVEGTELK
jgi:sugar lactone lactonase YvrE